MRNTYLIFCTISKSLFKSLIRLNLWIICTDGQCSSIEAQGALWIISREHKSDFTRICGFEAKMGLFGIVEYNEIV